MRSVHLRSSIPIGAIVLLSVMLFLTREPILLGIGDFLVVRDDPRPADVVHVLGGGYDRLDYGLELYHQDFGQRLFITGRYYSDRYQAYVAARGVPRSDIVPIKSNASSTYEEALELRQFLDGESSIQSVMIVSSPFHMRRVQWIFTRVLGDRVSLQFVPVPFEVSWHQQQWWTHSRSSSMVRSEYVKFLYYRLRYGLQSVSWLPFDVVER